MTTGRRTMGLSGGGAGAGCSDGSRSPDSLVVEAVRKGLSLEHLLAAGGAGREELLRAAAAHLGCEMLDPAPRSVPEAILQTVPGALARLHGVVPLRAEGHALVLLAIDPLAPHLAADLAFALGRGVRIAVADPDAVRGLLARHHGGADAGLDDMLASLHAGAAPAARAVREPPPAEHPCAPAVRLVDELLHDAVRDGASDLHFEPFAGRFTVRRRIDGVLRDVVSPPVEMAPSVISRLKVVAGLDIAECRVPQDGRIRMELAGRTVDLRVSTLPTRSGESVVLRVLDPSSVRAGIGSLGMPDDVARGLVEAVGRPHGIILVTGPTGSGKTTTLYACLRLLNVPGRKLLTAEDPVEYGIDGVMQVPVNPAAGLTFAGALRAFLRQDPDVIMVGEIRDGETARTAVQAALTGHLVLSTLHTGGAAGAVTRLADLGVEPFLIAATLGGVLAQRLVRGICPHCREACEPDPRHLALLDPRGTAAGGECFRGRGCGRCGGTGFRGRTGLFEFLSVSGALRELVSGRVPEYLVQEQAEREGMRTLREAALQAVLAGATTSEEAVRAVG